MARNPDINSHRAGRPVQWTGGIARWSARVALALLCLLSGPLALLLGAPIDLDTSWQSATHERTGLAPDPATTSEAIVQVYGARAFNWRGFFGIHTWVATKERAAPHYEIHQVLGWYARRGGRAVVSRRDYPDREWFGAQPTLLGELRGPRAERAIAEVRRAVASYPHDREYRIWPGPNSNTFVAYITRRVPELAADLPPSAIGKDFLAGGATIGPAPSGTGFQISLRGFVGILIGPVEGWEVNLLGLGFGLDPAEPALRLPGIGKIGGTAGAARRP